MSSINEIAKKALLYLKEHDLPPSPVEFAKAFCAEAKKEGLHVADCEGYKKFVSKLDAERQKKLASYNVTNQDEFVSFLIGQLKHGSKPEDDHGVAMLQLTKKILKAIEKLKNKNATKLAITTQAKLESKIDEKLLSFLAQEWSKFYSELNYDYLRMLDELGRIRKDDFSETVNDLFEIIVKCKNSLVLDDLASLVSQLLTPSIATEIEDEIGQIKFEMTQNPKLLLSASFQQKLLKLLDKRLLIDRQNIKDEMKNVDSLIEKIGGKLLGAIGYTTDAAKNISEIKAEFGSIDFNAKHATNPFEAVRIRLEGLLNRLDKDTNSLVLNLKEDEAQIGSLKQRVHMLEKKLEEALLNSFQDHLTKLLNRRGIENELEILEERFVHDKEEYSVIYFDIDFFKKINDTYGHDAGDVILKSFSQLLKKNSKQEFHIGRYGGEEFLAVLPGTSLSEALEFARKVASATANTKFLYKSEKLAISFSAGISCRSEAAGLKECIDLADARLYNAKKNGRNLIVWE